MAKRRILLALLLAGLITSLASSSNDVRLRPEPKQLTDCIDLDLIKNYELREMEQKLDIAFEKIKEEELKRQQEEEKRRLAEEERLRQEEERLRQEELERQRIAEEERIKNNRIYCKFEISFYTTAPDEGSGTGIGASGEYVQPWVSIALPSDIPFYSTAYIEGLGTFYNHDTGSYIQWTYDEYGNLVCRVDVCVSTKEEAYALGRYYADGYIDLNAE